MENNLFKIHSEYKPMGDQPTAIESIVKNIERGVKDQVLLGVTGSGKTFYYSQCYRKATKTCFNNCPK